MDFASIPAGIILGFTAWFIMRHGIGGIFTVNQDERAVKTRFGKAVRGSPTSLGDNPATDLMRDSEKDRYRYPTVEVIPSGIYFRWPWEKVHKVSISTRTVSMAFDPESKTANRNGTVLDAVTKDQLNVGLNGQLRFRVSERNLYAYLFGVKNPIAHVMGYFISVLRERIANMDAPASDLPAVPGAQNAGVSINHLRKNLRQLNDFMEQECKASTARYGIELDAALITGIDPPDEVDSALAAINTAHNQVSSDISLAQASADQKIVQSRRAVEIETLHAEAEVEPLMALAEQLKNLKRSGPNAIGNYVRSVKLGLWKKADHVVIEEKGQ